MSKPVITISSKGAKIKSFQWVHENMFHSSLLACWVDFLNETLKKDKK
jgi:hypothetical protein